MTELAKFYFHVREIELDEKVFGFYGEHLQLSSEKVARNIFEEAETLQIDLKEGSLKGCAIVYGIMSTLFGGGYAIVANYPEFKEGLIEICEDAQRFGSDICDDLLHRMGQDRDSVIIRRYKGVPGQVLRAFEETEYLRGERGDMSSAEEQAIHDRLERRMLRLDRALENEADRELFLPRLFERTQSLSLPSSEAEIEDVRRRNDRQRRISSTQAHGVSFELSGHDEDEVEDEGRFYRAAERSKDLLGPAGGAAQARPARRPKLSMSKTINLR